MADALEKLIEPTPERQQLVFSQRQNQAPGGKDPRKSEISQEQEKGQAQDNQKSLTPDLNQAQTTRESNPEGQRGGQRKPVICYRFNQPGHIAYRCLEKDAAGGQDDNQGN